MAEMRPLYVPVILGTTRKGRMSLPVARLMADEVAKRRGVETELIDIAQLRLPVEDADKFLKELLWMAATLRYGRKHVALG